MKFGILSMIQNRHLNYYNEIICGAGEWNKNNSKTFFNIWAILGLAQNFIQGGDDKEEVIGKNKDILWMCHKESSLFILMVTTVFIGSLKLLWVNTHKDGHWEIFT